MCDYLSEKVLQFSKSNENKLGDFEVTYGIETHGDIEIVENLKIHNHEEADTLLLLHAVSLDPNCEFVIQPPDTGVLILLITMYGKLPPNICFQTGKGDKIRKIDVGKVFCGLGELRSSPLLGFHAFTGSDVTGKFAGRSKEFCFKIFLSCNEDILIGLKHLGNTLSGDDCKALEWFVYVLPRNENHTNVSELRLFLYCHRKAQAESLPSTQGTLILHVMRAYYISKIWKSSLESIISLPPIDFG